MDTEEEKNGFGTFMMGQSSKEYEKSPWSSIDSSPLFPDALPDDR
jgi:hypothetical protein